MSEELGKQTVAEQTDEDANRMATSNPREGVNPDRKKGGSCLGKMAIGCGLVLLLFAVAFAAVVMVARSNAEREREQQEVAKRRATELIDSATQAMESGDLLKAYEQADKASKIKGLRLATVLSAEELRRQAKDLLVEAQRTQVALLVRDARDAMSAGDIPAAKDYLRDASGLVHAPNREAATDLAVQLERATSEDSVRQVVGKWTANQLENFKNSRTIPEIKLFDDAALCAATGTVLRANRGKIEEWFVEEKQRRRREVLARFPKMKEERPRLLEERRVAAEAVEEYQPLKFIISGKIRYGDEKTLAVFGLALPRYDNTSKVGRLYEEGNIEVEAYDPKRVRGDQYFNGEHFFLRKSSAKNAFGVEVPVWVYGDEPVERKRLRESAKARLEEIDKRWNEFSSEYREMMGEYFDIVEEQEKSKPVTAEDVTAIENFRKMLLSQRLPAQRTGPEVPKRAVRIGDDWYEIFNLGAKFVQYQSLNSERAVSICYVVDPTAIKKWYSIAEQLQLMNPTDEVDAELRIVKLFEDEELQAKANLSDWKTHSIVFSDRPELQALVFAPPSQRGSQDMEYAFIVTRYPYGRKLLAVLIFEKGWLRATPFYPGRSDRTPEIEEQSGY